jgi:phosphoglycerate dehydrogenase-like enzyme
MIIFKATNTLDGYLPELTYTTAKEEAEVILVGGKPFDLAEFPKLKGVFKTGVGTDNLPFDRAKKLGVKIALPSPETCDTIYDETAAFTCHLIFCALYAGCGEWDSWKKVDRPMTSGRTLLVIGTGRIGGKVVEKMQKLVTVTTFDAATDPATALEALIRAADCISLHIPLMPATQGFFGIEKLAWMKDGAALVNTARGPVVDEDALFAELNSGRLRAAFDVYWKEPYRGILADLPADRFIRSPHIASTCKEFLQGTANDFLNFLDDL